MSNSIRQFSQNYKNVSKYAMATGLLSFTEFSVYQWMLDDFPFYMKERGHFSPSQNDYAVSFGVSRRTMGTIFKKLEELGLIVPVSKDKGFATKYKVVSIETALTILNEAVPVEELTLPKDVVNKEEVMTKLKTKMHKLIVELKSLVVKKNKDAVEVAVQSMEKKITTPVSPVVKQVFEYDERDYGYGDGEFDSFGRTPQHSNWVPF